MSRVEIDADLLEAAKSATGLGTERAVVEAGLRFLLQLNDQERFREFRGKVKCEEAPEESQASRFLEGRSAGRESLGSGGGVFRALSLRR